MNYDSFLGNFLSGISQCLDWLKNLFVDADGVATGSSEGSAIFTHPLIFTIMGISLFTLIIEELVGVLTSFRFGGFFFRRFGRGYGSGYRTKYETEYPKSYEVDYSVETAKPFKSRFGTKYFINYNGKYYPFYHSRYNPLYARQFNVAYRAGRVATASQIYGQKISNANSSSYGNSYSSYSSSFNPKVLKEAFKYGSDIAQNGFDIFKEEWKKHQEKNAPVQEDAHEIMGKVLTEEAEYNDRANFQSLVDNESNDASYDGPRPPNLDITVDDD